MLQMQRYRSKIGDDVINALLIDISSTILAILMSNLEVTFTGRQ